MTIKNEALLIVPPDMNDGVIINDGNSPIIIEGGNIVIDFKNDEDYQFFSSMASLKQPKL